MPEPTDLDDRETSRRRVLKATSAAAMAGLGLGTAGTAAAAPAEPASHCDDPADEFFRVRCNTDLLCMEPSADAPYLSQVKHCVDCNGDGTYECSDWESNGCCTG